MKINVLCENYVKGRGLVAEHGLSLYIEKDTKKILFDMGQTDVFEKNSKILEIDLKSIDFAVLSHGHYDHGGGALRFSEINTSASVYINKNAFGDYFSKNGYIGLDKSLKDQKNVVLLNESLCVCEDIVISSGYEIKKIYDNYSKGLEKETLNGREEDDFLHEQYLVINENNKKILISGCSHRGILNIMEYFQPDVFIGGLHLCSMDTEQKSFMQTADLLSSYNCEYYVGHCTGIEQYSALKQVLGERIKYIHTGASFEI